MQPLEIDSAVFCDGAHYTIISRENSSILTCPVTSGAGGYALNRAEGGGIDREIGRLTGHAACIAVDVPTWCRIVRHAVAQHGRSLPRGAPRRRVARALPLAHRPVRAGPRRQEGSGLKNKGRGRRARAGALGRRFPFGNTRSHGRAPTLSSGQYPYRRLPTAAPFKELRNGAHRPRI